MKGSEDAPIRSLAQLDSLIESHKFRGNALGNDIRSLLDDVKLSKEEKETGCFATETHNPFGEYAYE